MPPPIESQSSTEMSCSNKYRHKILIVPSDKLGCYIY